MKRWNWMIIFILLVSAACTAPPNPVEAPPPAEEAAAPPTEKVEETAAPTETPTEAPTPSATALLPAPPDPQMIAFNSEDGQALTGWFYPVEQGPAPLVIMMHQANYDQAQWKAIAPWLQNRGVEMSAKSAPGLLALVVGEPWLDSSWFPQVPDGLKVSVFTFTLRNCDGGCEAFENFEESWQDDILAAFETAAQLPGVDPDNIFALGTSIGADGSVDGCWLYQQKTGHSCAGALAVSPGSFIGMPFDETVKNLTQSGVPVVCYSADQDYSIDTCNSYEGDLYQTVIVPGYYHGIDAVNPEAEPNWLEPLLDFLQELWM